MAFPLIPLALGFSTVVGGHLTRQVAISGIRHGLGTFGQGVPFGAGYSLGTYLGFPKNFQEKSSYASTKIIRVMPYGYSRYPRRRYYRRRRSYGYRRYSRYYRRY